MRWLQPSQIPSRRFFSARGFDEATGTLTEGTDLKAAQAVLEEKVKLFEEAYHNEMGAGDDVKLPGREFTKTRLRSSDFVLYGEDIPDNYLGQLRNGSVVAEAYYDPADPAGRTFAVIISAEHDGFKEMIWISVRPEFMRDSKAIIDFLKFFINECRQEGSYRGVFIELHVDEHTSEMAKLLEAAGMQVYTEKNNIYECTLKEVAGERELLMAAQRLHCRPLAKLSEKERDDIESRIEKSRFPVPVALPIMWNTYRQDLSFAYMGSDPKEAGLLQAACRKAYTHSHPWGYRPGCDLVLIKMSLWPLTLKRMRSILKMK